MVGGVGDRQEVIGREPVGEEVVNHATLLVAQARVLRPADLEPGDVVGEHALQKRRGLRPLGLDLPHVGDVEHPGVRPHRRVLLPDPVVLDRHLPAGEGNEPGAGGGVEVVERGAAEGGGGHEAAGYPPVAGGPVTRQLVLQEGRAHRCRHPTPAGA